MVISRRRFRINCLSQLLGSKNARRSIFESYVYWNVHHLDSWVKRDQLDVTCFIISLFNAQHVSDVLTSETYWALNKEIIKQVTSCWSLFTQRSIFLHFLTLAGGTDRLSQKSVRNYHCTLRNTPEERRRQTHLDFFMFQVAMQCNVGVSPQTFLTS